MVFWYTLTKRVNGAEIATHYVWRGKVSVGPSLLVRQFQGLVGTILRPVHFIPPEVYVLKYAKVI